MRVFVNEPGHFGLPPTSIGKSALHPGNIFPSGTEYQGSQTFLEITGNRLPSNDDLSWDASSTMSKSTVASNELEDDDARANNIINATRLICPGCNGEEFKRYVLEKNGHVLMVCTKCGRLFK